MSTSAASVIDETESVSTTPGMEGEIVPLPVTGDVGVESVGVEARGFVPEGEVQAGPAALLVTQADTQPVSCSGVGI